MLEVEEQNMELVGELSEKYPSLYLGEPFRGDFSGMNTYEARFVDILLERDLVVFREPLIADLDCVPDFFVYNPRSGSGKLVEITLMPRNGNGGNGFKTKIRKARQNESLASSGIPYVVLYREELEKVRDYCRWDLF